MRRDRCQPVPLQLVAIEAVHPRRVRVPGQAGDGPQLAIEGLRRVLHEAGADGEQAAGARTRTGCLDIDADEDLVRATCRIGRGSSLTRHMVGHARHVSARIRPAPAIPGAGPTPTG